MKLNYPSRISIIICTIFLLISYLTLYISNLIYVNFYFISLLALPIMLILTTTILNRFFYERIRVIYKKIYKFRGTSKFSDIDIDKVEKEAEEWAEAKEEELFQMKKDENYRREFIGNVSHELKTPIFNIQGYINTLLDGAISDNKINRKFLSRANKSVSRMIYIVEDLDQITRLEEGKIEIENKSFDLLTEINDVVENLDIKAKKRGLKIKIINNYKSKIPVKGDKEKIKQVLYNLIENSIKYGNDMSTIDIKLYDMDVNILTEVSDSGNGIEQKHLNKIFDRFYRVDSSRDREKGGSGLGLSIVKHIIEAHGHSINVRSTIGEGSTFSFTLTKSK